MVAGQPLDQNLAALRRAGLIYWLTLLFLGKSPAELLRVMPVAAGLGIWRAFRGWLIAMRPAKPRFALGQSSAGNDRRNFPDDQNRVGAD